MIMSRYGTTQEDKIIIKSIINQLTKSALAHEVLKYVLTKIAAVPDNR